jgi:hypothetical protein
VLWFEQREPPSKKDTSAWVNVFSTALSFGLKKYRHIVMSAQPSRTNLETCGSRTHALQFSRLN